MVAIAQSSIKTAGFFERLQFMLNKPNIKNKTVFFRLLAVSQKAGLGLREALVSIKSSEQSFGMKIVLKDLLDQINQWNSFAKSMEIYRGFFGGDEVELVRASEGIGNMPDALMGIAAELENFQKIRGKVKSAMTYPIVLVVFAIIAVIILLIKVVPTFVGLFAGHELPIITQYMLRASDFMQAYWWLIIGGMTTIAVVTQVLYRYFLPFKIAVDGISLKFPVLKDVVKTFYLYRLSKLLSDFYKAWVSPVVALEQIAAIFSNYQYKKKMQDIRTDLEAGFGFGESLTWSSLVDPILVQIVLVGEKTGNIDEVLAKMAVFYDNALEDKIKSLMALIEPLLMGFVAVLVGGIAASIFLPMADLVNTIN